MTDKLQPKETNSKPKQVIIIGAGGHGKVIADIVTRFGDVVLGFLDDKDANSFGGMIILGRISEINKYIGQAVFIVAVGDNKTRKEIMENNKVDWYTAIHPTAVIASDVTIGEGTAIMANAVINTSSKIGRGVIINTAATIDHDSVISDYVHISPGGHLGGTVRIGAGTWIGIGAVVSNNVDICEGCIVGAGAVVIRHIKVNGVYTGIPAKMI